MMARFVCVVFVCIATVTTVAIAGVDAEARRLVDAGMADEAVKLIEREGLAELAR